MVRRIITVIQILLIFVFLCCAAYTAKYIYDLNKSETQYETLKQELGRSSNEDASAGYEEQRDENGILSKYSALYEKNNDMVGWVRVKNTAIDYPVVQAENNEYYLRRDFYKNKQFCAVPFLDCDSSLESSNYIIYAHNMKNGTMFAAVAEYADREFFEAHKIIEFDTLYERGRYEVISVFRTSVGSKNEFRYHDYADIHSEEAFNEYVNAVKAKSIHPTSSDVSYGDRLITLSTCAYGTSNERIVVAARKKHK